MPTLSQRLGSFPTESRAESFLQCRQDCPLPSSINRGGFHDLREEKSGSKVGQKPASLPRFCSFLSLSLPTVPATNQSHYQLLHHRKPTQPPTDHQASIAALSLLLPAFLSPSSSLSLSSATFSSSSHSRLRPPSPQSKPPEPPARHPQHVRDP